MMRLPDPAKTFAAMYVRLGTIGRELFTPPIGGGTPPIDVNAHPQTALPIGCVCTVLVVYSYTA